MKLKYEFTVREIVGEYVLIPLGEGALAFSGMIATSETGALLAKALQRDVTREELEALLMAEYEVEEATLREDLDAFLAELKRLDLLENL